MNTNASLEDRLLTPDEVCQYLKITKTCLWDWVAGEKIKPFRISAKVIRFREVDVLALVNQGGLQR